MSCEEATAQVLKESGQRLTPQRLLILSAVRHARGHVTAAQVLEEVRASYPYIDISTVYRTLAALRDMRLISETHLGSGEHRYEWLGDQPHHHLICRQCGHVADLDHQYMEELRRGLLEHYGFQADLDHFAIFGLCRRCRPGSGEGGEAG